MANMSWCILLLALVIFSQHTKAALPDNSKPFHYDLELSLPKTETDKFEGKVNINFDILRTTKVLKLHSRNLDLDQDKTLIVGEAEEFRPTVQRHSSDILELVFPEKLPLGTYSLHLEYSSFSQHKFTWYPLATGIRNSGLPEDAFDMFSGSNETGEKYILVGNSGNSQPKARDYFPCWDGPEFKSTFNVSIKHAPDSIVFSYMTVKSTTDGTDIDGRKLSYFPITPKITASKITFSSSNYLSLTHSEKFLQLWSSEHVSDYTRFGFKNLLAAIPLMRNFKYTRGSHPKTDIIVIPCDSSSTSYVIQNSGPFIFCQHDFLSHYKSSAMENITTIQNIVDRVTSRMLPDMLSAHWFNDSWGWKGLRKYINNGIAAALTNIRKMGFYYFFESKMKSLSNSEDSKDFEAQPKVDDEKAGSMIRMLNDMLPPKAFLSILDRMFKRSPTIRGGFWKLMEKTYNRTDLTGIRFDFKRMMNAYATQTGYPILDVTRNYTSGTIKVTQEIVFANKEINPNNGSLQYRIPINFATKSSLNFSSTLPTHWMNPNEELIIEGVDRNDWFIFNIRDIGYYRVNYDEENWHRIANYLNSDEYSHIHHMNRAALLGDALMLYRTNRLEKNILLELISYLTREQNSLPWLTGLGAIEHLLLSAEPDETKVLARNLLNSFLNESAPNNGSHTGRSYLRKLVNESAVRVQSQIE